MTKRANYQKENPQAVTHLFAFEKAMKETALPPILVDLVKIRVSQMNGCLFCLDMHHKEARTHGERELRLYHLAAWRESPLFSEKERAALEWAELLTRPGSHGAEDSDYEKISAHYSEKDISDLTLVIAAINAWNRLGVAFRPVPGQLDKMLGLDKIGLH
jgi:AhpD family alkylhydroperoxidase